MLTNYKTTIMGLVPLIAYGLKAAGWWPENMPLPPFDEVWPFLLGIVGLGVAAKDRDVTGGDRYQ